MRTIRNDKIQRGELLTGLNPVLEAVKKGERNFDRIYIAKGRGGPKIDELIKLARDRDIHIRFEQREIIDKLADTANHQGVVGVVSAKEYTTVDEILSIAEKRKEQPFIIILDGIDNPQNLGGIIRSAEAAGVHGIIIPERRAVGITDAVAKSSAGAVEYVAVAKVGNINNTIAELKEKGIWIVGVDMKGEKRYCEMDYKMPLAVVIGSEGEGVKSLVIKNCDFVVSIPQKGKVNSLNASVAAGIIIFEILKSRLA